MSTQFVRRLIYTAYETPRGLNRCIAQIKKMNCDRVMLFNTRGHNEPAHLDREEILRRAAVMAKAAAAFRDAGIGVGINNLATVGMNFSPPRKHRFPFQNLIDPDGRAFTETFCPLDKQFLDYLDFLYTAWAGIEAADEVWIDDDFRYKSGVAQCFCPLHLAGFGERTGRSWTREELTAAISAPGLLPNDLARQWGGFQNDGLFGAARTIAEAVRRRNPKMRIAFMGIITSTGMYGSEYLHQLAGILSPDRPLLVRPEYGNYSDDSRTGFCMYTPTWCCHRAFGDHYLGWPELETWPWSRHNHSGRIVQTKLAWAAAFGFHDSTLNVSDDPDIVRTVVRSKRQVVAISELVHQPALKPRGVSLELSENTIGLRSAPGWPRLEILPPRILTRLGLPLWPEGGCGRILVGNAPLVRPNDLPAFAREGLLLDRSAFDTLAAMGRDDILGGARPRAMGGIPVEETFARDPRNGGAAGKTMSMEMAIQVRPHLEGFSLPETPEFATLSWFEDADGLKLSAGAWTREWAGGRLAVLPFSLNEPASEHAFLNPERKAQIEGLLAWLAGSPLPVRLDHVADLAVVYRESPGRDRIVIGLVNYSQDDADHVTLMVPALAGKTRAALRSLDGAARWKTAELTVGPEGSLKLGRRFAIPSQEVRLLELTPLA